MAKQPKTYTAPHPVYTGGKLYNPGERFTTYDRPGKEWNDTSRRGRTMADAATPAPPPTGGLLQGRPDTKKGGTGMPCRPPLG